MKSKTQPDLFEVMKRCKVVMPLLILPLQTAKVRQKAPNAPQVER